MLTLLKMTSRSTENTTMETYTDDKGFVFSFGVFRQVDGDVLATMTSGGGCITRDAAKELGAAIASRLQRFAQTGT